jgi:hypothetical protein
MIILIEEPEFDTALIYSDNVFFISGLRNRIRQEAKMPAEVSQGIRNGDFDTSPDNFYASLQAAYNGVHGHHLARRSLSSIRKMKTFRVFNLLGFNSPPFRAVKFSSKKDRLEG